MSAVWKRSYGYDLLLSAAVNLGAALLMKFVLEGATPTGGSDAERLAYIASHRAAVIFAWGAWVAATLTLLLAFWVLAISLDQRWKPQLRFAFAVATVGAALDIAADVLHMSAIPALAEAYRAAEPATAASVLISFRAWDAAAVALTGGGGNTLYVIAGAIVTWVMFRTAWIPRWLSVWGAAVWTAAAAASAALFWAPALLPLMVGTTMALYVTWIAACGLVFLARRDPPYGSTSSRA